GGGGGGARGRDQARKKRRNQNAFAKGETSAGANFVWPPPPAVAGRGPRQALIPARAIDHVLERQPRLEALDLAQHVGGERARVGGSGVVRRDGDLGVAPERARRRKRLARKDVERCPPERTLLDPRQDISVAPQPPPP